MGLIARLGKGPVALDTAIFVYLIEAHPRFLPAVAEIFGAIDAGRLAAATSALTLLEVLVVPFRTGNLALAQNYEEILSRSRGLRLVEIDRSILRTAAGLRASHPKLRTPDALQLATALAVRATAFVTNDRELPKVPGLAIVQLGELVAGD